MPRPNAPVAAVVLGLAPLVAVVLFFMTRSWLWFLLVPVVGVVLYGINGDR